MCAGDTSLEALGLLCPKTKSHFCFAFFITVPLQGFKDFKSLEFENAVDWSSTARSSVLIFVFFAWLVGPAPWRRPICPFKPFEGLESHMLHFNLSSGMRSWLLRFLSRDSCTNALLAHMCEMDRQSHLSKRTRARPRVVRDKAPHRTAL